MFQDPLYFGWVLKRHTWLAYIIVWFSNLKKTKSITFASSKLSIKEKLTNKPRHHCFILKSLKVGTSWKI